MEKPTYIDLVAMLGIEDAHPGGFALTKQILDSLTITAQTNVLEVGCGSGKTASYLSQTFHCPITAIDMNKQMLQTAKGRFQKENIPVSLIFASAEQLPFSVNTFDLVVSESVTAFTNVEKSLSEYQKVLKKNGLFLAIEMISERPLSSQEQLEVQSVYGIEKVYTEEEWKELFYKAGFQKTFILGGSAMKDALSTNFIPLYLHKLSPALLEIFYQHQGIIYIYQEVLGYRVFLCTK